MIDNFSKFGWKVPLKNKNAETVEGSSENAPISPKISPILIETKRGENVFNKIFTCSLKKTISKE